MSTEKRNTILRLLVEGNSVRGIARLMDTNIASVLRQLTWAGEHCRNLMDAKFATSRCGISSVTKSGRSSRRSKAD